MWAFASDCYEVSFRFPRKNDFPLACEEFGEWEFPKDATDNAKSVAVR